MTYTQATVDPEHASMVLYGTKFNAYDPPSPSTGTKIERSQHNRLLAAPRTWGRLVRPYITPVASDSESEWVESIEETRSFREIDEISPEPPMQQEIEADEATGDISERMHLLARKYVEKQFSAEEEARLAVVTERVRKLVPSISEEDLSIMEEIDGGLEAMRRQVLQIQEEFDLDAQVD